MGKTELRAEVLVAFPVRELGPEAARARAAEALEDHRLTLVRMGKQDRGGVRLSYLYVDGLWCWAVVYQPRGPAHA